MPLVGFKGTAAANAYGFLSSKRLVFVTFPAGTSTWTAPVGVNLVVSAVGRGADGVAGYWSTAYPSYLQQCFQSTGSNVATRDWATLYSAAQAAITSLNSGGAGVRVAPSGIQQRFYSINSSDFDTGGGASISGWFNGKLIRGTAVLGTQGSPPTSGQVLYSQVSSLTGWYIDGTLEYYVNPVVGASTTAFGLTFPGGTGTTPADTTFNNISVTPLSNYTIVNNGALTISYFA